MGMFCVAVFEDTGQTNVGMLEPESCCTTHGTPSEEKPGEDVRDGRDEWKVIIPTHSNILLVLPSLLLF